MTRQPRPPRPASSLARLLARLGEELRQVPIDPDLGRLVEARIRAGPVAPRHARRRSIPGWAAVAAGVLLTLGAGMSTRSAAPPLDRRAQLPLAPPPGVEEVPDPPPLEPREPPEEAPR